MTETGRRLSAEAVMGIVIAARTCVEGASVKAQYELNGDVPLPGQRGQGLARRSRLGPGSAPPVQRTKV